MISETTTPPAMPTQTPETRETRPFGKVGANRYTLIFGVALAAVTIIALLLAFFSSDFRPRASQALPASWTQAYNADLTGSDTGAWDESQGCSLTRIGLDASPTDTSDAQCAFMPSIHQSVTAHGFYFVTQLAPAAKVSAFARSVISVGDISGTGGATVHFVVGQDGSYTLCDGDCLPSSSAIYERGGLAAWHGDALVANTVAIKVTPDHSALSVYVNDQEVATVASQFGPQPAIALGAPAGDEALFTHATLYTGQ
ncbi:MAG TPA: hypothetical protein VFN78_05755 [Ktedonobacterales bacterium]|nr:hypothetical protein [Ktedonobacterales bacterium]